MSGVHSGDRRVVVVTGGGGGIGAAIAEELGRRGDLVVTVDPLVTLDGSERMPSSEETTAGRIVAAGGVARASSASVTDRDAIKGLFDDLAAEHGRLDAVVNVAGISRPTSFAGGTAEDWLAVLAVHFDGYRNILDAALPIMAAACRGHILGVTSGSGWRAADAGAYGCAKRAVAALTWQLGREAPPGVVINAISPIAVTRMVTAALSRSTASAGSGSSATGGLSLESMPAPGDLAPLAAHMVCDELDWCRGQVLFAGGSELAVVEPPRLLELVQTRPAPSLAHLLEAVTARAFVPAEARQASTGGSNPRFGAVFDAAGLAPLPPAVVRTCVVVADRPDIRDAVTRALDARGVTCVTVPPDLAGAGLEGARAELAGTAADQGSLDAIVVALAASNTASDAVSGWETVLADHSGMAEQIHADAMWARAAADHAAASDRPIRFVTLTDAAHAGGASRAQAAAQLARASRRATDDRVAAFAVAVEGTHDVTTVGELAAHLVASADALELAGAELAVGDGWVGLRSHPRPTGSIVLGSPALPEWFDDALRGIVGGTATPAGPTREPTTRRGEVR